MEGYFHESDRTQAFEELGKKRVSESTPTSLRFGKGDKLLCYDETLDIDRAFYSFSVRLNP